VIKNIEYANIEGINNRGMNLLINLFEELKIDSIDLQKSYKVIELLSETTKVA